MTVSSPSSWTMGYSHISAFPVRTRTTLSGQSEPVWLRFADVEQVRRLWCKRYRSSNQRLGSRHWSRGEHCIPNLGSGFVFDAKLAEFELTFSDPVHEFDAGDRRCGSPKLLEAEHRTNPQLDRSVILLNQIVEVFGRPDLASISLRMFAESLFGRAMRGLIAIERDLMRQSALGAESSPEERLGGCDVPLGAQQEIDGRSLFVDPPIEIGPSSFDFDVGFVDAPGPTNRASEAVPALFEFRDIALDPTHDRGVRQREPAFGHHLDEVSKPQFVPQIPPHTENDDLPVEMTAFEKFIHA